MIRLMMKMLWARKKRYGWLLSELLLVSIIMWVLLDPLVILYSIKMTPDGFEDKGLYRVVLAERSANAASYDTSANGFEQKQENKWRMLELIRNQPMVENATFFGPVGPFCMSSSVSSMKVDTLTANIWGMNVVPGSDYFQTMQFQEVDGQTNIQLDKALQGQSGESTQKVVLSADVFPGRTVLGDTIGDKRVVGTTAMVRMRGGSVPVPVASLFTQAASAQDIVVRVREGIDEAEFLSNFTDWAKRKLQIGNYYVRGVQPFGDFMDEGAKEEQQQFRVRSVLGAFFLLFLFLGVTGTFWMQTRSRCEEIGIMKSFGATSSAVVRSFLMEGIVLVSCAVGVACLLYLQYAMKEGLYNPIGNDSSLALYAGRYWFEHFPLHFAVISLLVWLLLLFVVSLGIYIPARSMSRIAPTEALKEE